MGADKRLVAFIKEARKRGFDDFQIREPLIKKGWKFEEIEKAFRALQPKYKYKNKVSIFLDSKLLHKLEIRAKKNLLTLPEQIEDILRRSVLSQSKRSKEEKLEDPFIGLFSRKQTNKKK